MPGMSSVFGLTLALEALTHLTGLEAGLLRSYVSVGAGMGNWLCLTQQHILFHIARWLCISHSYLHKYVRERCPGMLAHAQGTRPSTGFLLWFGGTEEGFVTCLAWP